MEIYLAIIWTYLCVSFTIFLFILFINRKTNKDIKKDNSEWKNEVRERLNIIYYEINKLWKT